METKATKHIKVESSNIESVGYDRANLELEVTFKGGATYRYSHVLPEKVVDMLFAQSIGSHFSKEVKPHHPCVKVSEAVH